MPADLDLRSVSAAPPARVRRARRLGRIERDRVRELGTRCEDEPLRRLHRYLRRDHRARAGPRPAYRRGTAGHRAGPHRGRAEPVVRSRSRVPGAGALARATGREQGRRDRRPAAGTLGGSAEGDRRRGRELRVGRAVPRDRRDAGGADVGRRGRVGSPRRGRRPHRSPRGARRAVARSRWGGDRRRQRRDATRVRSRAPAARGARRRGASARPVLREHRPRAARRDRGRRRATSPRPASPS